MASELKPTDADRKAAAHRWMGQLPRDQFDLLLIICGECRADSTRTGRLAGMEEAAVMVDDIAKTYRSTLEVIGESLALKACAETAEMLAEHIRAAMEG